MINKHPAASTYACDITRAAQLREAMYWDSCSVPEHPNMTVATQDPVSKQNWEPRT